MAWCISSGVVHFHEFALGYHDLAINTPSNDWVGTLVEGRKKQRFSYAQSIVNDTLGVGNCRDIHDCIAFTHCINE